jgi:hypothetical protein
MDHRIIVVVRQIVRRDQPKGDETDSAKPGGALRDTFERAAAAMANALDKHCNLLVKMTSPRWGQKTVCPANRRQCRILPRRGAWGALDGNNDRGTGGDFTGIPLVWDTNRTLGRR